MKAPIVVIDAANGVGRGVVEAGVAVARPVVAVSADTRELALLRERFHGADLTALRGSIADEAGSAALAAALRDLGRPIAGFVIDNAGEPERGRVLDQPVAALQRRLERDVVPQLAAARALLPVLADSGRGGGYVVIGGPGGEHPWLGYGGCSVAAAAANMLVRVLHDEARTLGVRVQLLAVNRPVRTARNRDCACAGWPDASAIGAQALALIDRVETHTADAAVVPFTDRSATRSAAIAARADAPEASGRRLAVLPSSIDPASQQVLDQTWRALEPIFVSIKNEPDGQ